MNIDMIEVVVEWFKGYVRCMLFLLLLFLDEIVGWCVFVKFENL